MPFSPASKSFDAPFQIDTSRPASGHIDDKLVDPLKAKHEKNILDSENLNEKEGSEKTVGKKFSRFLVTNIGMITVVLIYVFGGAYLFQILEQHDEISKCQTGEGLWTTKLQAMRSQLFNYIYLNTTSNPWLPFDNSSGLTNTNANKDGPSTYNRKISDWIISFRNDIIDLNSNNKYYGQDCENESMWTYFSALLFTFSVVSTIGYGHVAPTTWQGQLVCVCYALLGVPLFLISIANLSGVFADSFRYAYANWFCYTCKKYLSDDEKKEKANELNKNNTHDSEGSSKEDEFMHSSKSNIVDDDEEEEEENEKKKKVNVPLVIILSVLFGYIFLGGWIFSLVESWTIIQGFYFSFVSVFTIGFGDLIPGLKALQTSNTDKAVKNMIIAFFYIFVGMAIMAMCIDLMQDQMFTRVRALTEWLGLGKQYDNEEEIIEENEITEEEKEMSNKNDPTISGDSKISKSEKLKLQLESIREKNRLRNSTPAERTSTTLKLESPNWKELLGVPTSSKSETPVVENKRIIVKSLNETTRKAKDTEC